MPDDVRRPLGRGQFSRQPSLTRLPNSPGAGEGWLSFPAGSGPSGLGLGKKGSSHEGRKEEPVRGGRGPWDTRCLSRGCAPGVFTWSRMEARQSGRSSGPPHEDRGALLGATGGGVPLLPFLASDMALGGCRAPHPCSPNPWAGPEISLWPGLDRKRARYQSSLRVGKTGCAPGTCFSQWGSDVVRRSTQLQPTPAGRFWTSDEHWSIRRLVVPETSSLKKGKSLERDALPDPQPRRPPRDSPCPWICIEVTPGL